MNDKIKLIESLPNYNKLYNTYVNNINEPFIEYGFNLIDNDEYKTVHFIICPDIDFTDEIIENDLFKNVSSIIICCNYEQSLNKLNHLYNTCNNINASCNNLYVWFNCNEINKNLINTYKSENYIYNEKNYINRLLYIMQSYYDNNDNNYSCNIL